MHSKVDPVYIAASHNAINFLLGSQSGAGKWHGKLSSDLAASAFAYVFLKHCTTSYPRVASATHALEAWMTRAVAEHPNTDFIGQALFRIAIEDQIEECEIVKWHGDADAQGNAGLLITILGCLSRKIRKEVALQMLPRNTHDWDLRYGPHWGTYAIVTELIRAWLNDQDTETLARQLSDRRSITMGSWYGDVLLTSAAALTLNRLDRYWTTQFASVTWMLNLMAGYSDGVPVVSGLEVWDTSWALAAILPLDVSPIAKNRAIDWLQKMFIKSVGGWSWSEESNVVCCDSSSVACCTLQQARKRNVFVEATICRCKDMLHEAMLPDHFWPTFHVSSESKIHPCPIISARCNTLMDNSSINHSDAANAVLNAVATRGQSSEWFCDPIVTQGLTLWYLARFSGSNSLSGLCIATRLTTRVLDGSMPIESAACAALGLEAATTYLEPDEYTQKAILKLYELLLGSQHYDGSWQPSKIGVFGFGRSYSDDIFTTALVTIALQNISGHPKFKLLS